MENAGSPQPLDVIMTQYGLTNAHLVNVSTEQLSFKMVQKARKGRRVSPNVQAKILTALIAARGDLKLRKRDLFRYEMNAAAAKELTKALTKIQAKKISYPQFIELLSNAGIGGYHVDVAQNQMTFYGRGGEAQVIQGSALGLPPKTGLFDDVAIKAAISDAQKEHIDHPTFLKRIYEAGILSYDVNCYEKKIKYVGEERNYKELIGQATAPAEVKAVKKTAAKPKKKPLKNKQKSLTRKARLASNKRYFTKKKSRRR